MFTLVAMVIRDLLCNIKPFWSQIEKINRKSS
jgi:hypothetical protein